MSNRKQIMSWAILAAAMLSAAATAAQAQPKSENQIDELTVTGRPKDFGVIVRDYVAEGTARSPIGRVSRWDMPICPGVLGLTDAAAETVIDRVRAVAKAAGAPVSTSQPCHPNILVVFTREPQELIKFTARKTPQILGYHYVSQRKKLTSITQPVQAWYATATRDQTAVARLDSTEDEGLSNVAVVKPSRLQDGLSSVFSQVTVIVDTRKVTGMEMAPVADYVAMLALAQAKPADECGVLPSIRNLFFTDCDPARRPEGLSEGDTAYLRALYAMSEGLVGAAQRSALQGQVRGKLTR